MVNPSSAHRMHHVGRVAARCSVPYRSPCTPRSPAARSFSRGVQNLFGRKEELVKLCEWVQQRPVYGVTVMTGPSKCGKSTLLTEWAGMMPGVYILDLRQSRTVKTFATSLAQAVLPGLVPALQRVEVMELLQQENSLHAAMLLASQIQGGVPEQSPGCVTALQPVMDALRAAQVPEPKASSVVSEVISALDAAHAQQTHQEPGCKPYPTIIIDHFDAIAIEKTEFKELGTALRMRANNKTVFNILLVASDYWAELKNLETMGIEDWESAAIGNFNKQRAREFLQMLLSDGQQNTDKHACVSDADWEAIYRVVGGNAGDLTAAANAYREAGFNWPEGDFNLRYGSCRHDRVLRGLQGGSGFTGANFADAALYLLKHGGAVGAYDLVNHLGRHAGDGPGRYSPGAWVTGWKVLKALCQAGLLHYQPYDSWWHVDTAEDLLPLLDGSSEGYVVAAVSPLDLQCMRDLKDQLQNAIPVS